MQKVNDPAVRHTGSGALIRRFLPYLAKSKRLCSSTCSVRR